MFGLFAKKRSDTTAAKAAVNFINIDIEDLTVSFALLGGDVLTKAFDSYAIFYPYGAHREDGVFICDIDKQLEQFMERWKINGFAVLGDTVVRFSDFTRAVVARKKRSVRVRARICEAQRLS